MDILDGLLDGIEQLLQKLPNNNEFRDQLYEKYFKYRAMFETNPNDINLPYFLNKYLSELEIYLNNLSNKPPIEYYEPLPVIYNHNEYMDGIYNLQEYVDILSYNLEQVSKLGNIDEIKSMVDHIQEEYENINYRKQSLDQKICETLFKVMLKYIKDGRIEDAIATSEDFTLDMRIYLVYYFKQKILDLNNENKSADAEYAWKFIYSNDPVSFKDIELWKFIYHLENPNDNTLENLPVTKENKTNVSQSINDYKDHIHFKKSSRTKTAIVKNYFGYCEYKSLSKAVALSNREYYKIKDRIKKNVNIIFEEGIKVLFLNLDNNGVPVTDVQYYPLNGYYTEKSHLVSINFPTSAKLILPYSFCKCTLLKEIDLSNTNIEVIEDGAFSNSQFGLILFPNTLRIIGEYVFSYNKKLKEVDLSNTCIKDINFSAFAFTSICRIILPESLINIRQHSLLSSIMGKVEVDCRRCTNLSNVAITCLLQLSKNAWINVILPMKLKTKLNKVNDKFLNISYS